LAAKAKGTTEKLRYVIKTHAHVLALLQSYISSDFPALTLEEAQTKFKFAITAANARLNKGETIQAPDLGTETDLSTRTQRA
jgi:hypothetical protein